MHWFLAVFFSVTTLTQTALAQQVILSGEQAQEYLRWQNGQAGFGANGAGGGCFSSMINSTSQGIARTYEAQNNETEALIGISQNYMEMERQCGNDLAEVTMELNNAEADHEERLMQLPSQIELKKLEYRQALLALKQECEQSSGQVFTEWKQMVSTGVVTPERGGPMALFARGRNINQFQRLFYDDCLGSETNIERANLLAQQLSANIRILQAGIDASSMKLTALSENLSFRQGVIVENCMRQEAQLDYQSQLARNMASAANSAARTNNFLNALSATAVCISGPGGALETTVNGAGTGTTN